MRVVLKNTEEVCHYWANQRQDEGKAGSVYFNGKTIYSYGSHFPMARHVEGGYVLFTTRGYSVTTARHLSDCRQSIPGFLNVIECHNVEANTPGDHLENFEQYGQMIESAFCNLSKARQENTKDRATAQFNHVLDNARQYFALFTKDMKAEARKKAAKMLERWEADFQKGDYKERIIREEKRKAAERKKEQAARMKEQAEKLSAWLDGSSNYRPYNLDKVFLRIHEGKVETTKGAEVTVREARLLWRRIKDGRPVIGQVLSGYTVLAFNGVLKIGCHEIERAEVDRIGAALDLLPIETEIAA